MVGGSDMLLTSVWGRHHRPENFSQTQLNYAVKLQIPAILTNQCDTGKSATLNLILRCDVRNLVRGWLRHWHVDDSIRHQLIRLHPSTGRTDGYFLVQNLDDFLLLVRCESLRRRNGDVAHASNCQPRTFARQRMRSAICMPPALSANATL